MLVQKRFVVWVKRVDVVCIMRFVVKQLCIMRFGVCIMRSRCLDTFLRAPLDFVDESCNLVCTVQID